MSENCKIFVLVSIPKFITTVHKYGNAFSCRSENIGEISSLPESGNVPFEADEIKGFWFDILYDLSAAF